MIKRILCLVGLVGLWLWLGVNTAVASDRAGFSPACNTHELGENAVILVMTDTGLQALQSVSDCESVLAAQPLTFEPTALQLVSVQASSVPDSVTLLGFTFVFVLFITLLVLWGMMLTIKSQEQ